MIAFYLILTAFNNFPVSDAFQDQNYPVVLFVQNQYYVFWHDMRYYSPDRSVFGCRVTAAGVVLDPQGREILRDRAEWLDAAFDGANFLVAIQDSC
jgi:hypothetical protein